MNCLIEGRAKYNSTDLGEVDPSFEPKPVFIKASKSWLLGRLPRTDEEEELGNRPKPTAGGGDESNGGVPGDLDAKNESSPNPNENFGGSPEGFKLSPGFPGRWYPLVLFGER